MKHSKWTLILVVLFYSCNGDRNDYDLSHHYEPHVAIRHNGDNTDQHYYSVMLVVKKGTKVYAEKDSDDPYYSLEYSFDNPKGEEQIAKKTYRLNSEYEIRFYEYPIDMNSMDSTKINSTEFKAKVVSPPNYHPHQDPVFLHNGTIHKPDGSE